MTSLIWFLLLVQSTGAIDTRLGNAVAVADRLRGTSEVRVVREASADGDRQCGLADDSTLVAAARVIEAGGLKVSDDRRVPIVRLDLATALIKEVGLCVSNVRIVLSTVVVAVPQKSPGYAPAPGSRIGQLEVLSRQAMSWSAPADHGQRVRERVTEFVSQIVAEVKRANQ
jgi:hypothetical protein